MKPVKRFFIVCVNILVSFRYLILLGIIFEGALWWADYSFLPSRVSLLVKEMDSSKSSSMPVIPTKTKSLDTDIEVSFVKQQLQDQHLNTDFSTATFLILVYSSNSKEEREFRELARTTWIPAIRKMQTGEVLFFVEASGLLDESKNNTLLQNSQEALELTQEQMKYQDLVFLNVRKREQSRLLLESFRWLAHQRGHLFPKLKWFFKTYTNVYIHSEALYSMYQDLCSENMMHTMIGNVLKHSKVLSSSRRQSTEFDLDYYPPYMDSAGFWMTPDVADWVGWNGDEGFLQPEPNEEALLGIWLFGMKVSLLTDRRVLGIQKETRGIVNSIGCGNCYNSTIVFHHLKPEMISLAHKNYLQNNTPCKLDC